MVGGTHKTKQLHISQCKTGMRVSEDITNPLGAILVPKNAVLNKLTLINLSSTI